MRTCLTWFGILFLLVTGAMTRPLGAAPTDFLSQERANHTSTLLLSGKVLVAGGRDFSGELQSCEIYDPATGSWTVAASMGERRREHTATLLLNGEVLVTGGYDRDTAGPSEYLATSEIYNPETNEWRPTVGTLTQGRREHTATLLADGRVLVVGGKSLTSSYTTSAEIFNPATGFWTTVEPMGLARADHTATLMDSGEVLVAGGSNFTNQALAEAEVYDPLNDSWSVICDLNVQRAMHTATKLPDGRVLLTGGDDGNNDRADAEVYDPSVGNPCWTRLTSSFMSEERSRHSAVVLPSGKVLLVAGFDGGELFSSDTFDPQNSTFSPGPVLIVNRREHTATLLQDGRVLIVGGFNSAYLSSAEVLDPFSGTRRTGSSPRFDTELHFAMLLQTGEVLKVGGRGSTANPIIGSEVYNSETDSWLYTEYPEERRYFYAGTLLDNGEVLITGGLNPSNGTTFDSTEIYNREDDLWRFVGPLRKGRRQHTVTKLPNGQVLVVGGTPVGSGGTTNRSEIYDPILESWEYTVGSMNSGRVLHEATLLTSGKVLVTGGFSGGALRSAEVFDSEDERWTLVSSFEISRSGHTATLLSSNEVLIAGGANGIALASAEIYDVENDNWRSTGELATTRAGHTATLLPSGQVVVIGGEDKDGNRLSTTEVYSPTTGEWTAGPPLLRARKNHTASLLPNGEVVVFGGWNNGLVLDTEILSFADVDENRRPVINAGLPGDPPPQLSYGTPFTINGSGFRSDTAGGHGNSQSSQSDVPIVNFQPWNGGHQVWASVDAMPRVDDNSMSLTLSQLPPTLHPGWHHMTAVVGGVPSEPQVVDIVCSVTADAPTVANNVDIADVPLGTEVTWNAVSQGGRIFEWERDQSPIDDATSASYTTLPITADDSGARFRFVAKNGCAEATSPEVVLQVRDTADPEVSLVTPAGGEYWILSENGPQQEAVAWSMSDDIRLCRVDVRLRYSEDGGVNYQPIPENGGLIFTEGPGGACGLADQPTTTSFLYSVPALPPSGSIGSLYQIEVTVTDHVGKTETAASTNPFYIVPPNEDSVRTLILANLPRMETVMGISTSEKDALGLKLRELANNPQVDGIVVDLSVLPSLTALYNAWDNAPGNSELANDILFETGGLHEYLLNEVLPVYRNAAHLVLVGDDRIIPMARLDDNTVELKESAYPAGGDLAIDSTVSLALADDFYLTDDLLGHRSPINLDVVEDRTFLPDLAIGRLVETPTEIISTIAVFISVNGRVELATFDPVNDHRALVTGYDFLDDSANIIAEYWRNVFGVAPEAPQVCSELIGPGWTAMELHDALSGGYGAFSLNGHATHYQVGIPGPGGFGDIQGLDSFELTGGDDCGNVGTYGSVNLTGSFAYAVGCHGGLPVPGSCGSDLDLPQAFLRQGAVGFVANSGYGWGLDGAVGYSERLVYLFTQELAASATVEVGEAVRRAKERYYLEASRFNAYDEKVVRQWTFFGLPMFKLISGIGDPVTASTTEKFSIDQRPSTEYVGKIRVEKEFVEASTNPDYLYRLNILFDSSAFGVYTKRDVNGALVTEPGCPNPGGCYYSLGSLFDQTTGEADLPIQPYVPFDLQLGGYSAHGVLWMGGSYVEEGGWKPIFGSLISNGVALTDHGATPRFIRYRPSVRRRFPTEGDPNECRPADTEPTRLVLQSGEVFRSNGSVDYDVQRLYTDMEVEVYYFNNTNQPSDNCDRIGPSLEPGPFGGDYHEALGSLVRWQVPATDNLGGIDGVWRVVVVWDDTINNQWRSLELADDDGDGVWEGELRVPGGIDSLNYAIQAADRRGNVEWLDYTTADLPQSKQAFEIPLVTDVALQSGDADLSIQVFDAPDPAQASSTLAYTVVVDNAGPVAASAVEVLFPLPADVIYGAAAGSGWTCSEESHEVRCEREVAGLGSLPPISVFVTTPAFAGSLGTVVTVSALEGDPQPGNNSFAVQTTVGLPQVDVSVQKEGEVDVNSGDSVFYRISVYNAGPADVYGATVRDIFPPELEDVTWECRSTLGSACTANGTGDIEDLVDVLAEGFLTYTAYANVIEGFDGEIENTVTINVPGTVDDSDPSNDVSGAVVRTDEDDLLLLDGFESGDLSGWSGSVGSEP